jgi:cation transport regulator ChaC
MIPPMSEVDWLFSYGSNMHLDDLRGWLQRNGHATDGIRGYRRATLRDYRLIWNYYSKGRQGGAANIERAAGATLHGIALQVTRSTRDAIDQKEGYPVFYVRESVVLELEDATTTSASVYVVRAECCDAAAQWPTRAYLDLIVEAAIGHGLPGDHIAALKEVPVRDR